MASPRSPQKPPHNDVELNLQNLTGRTKIEGKFIGIMTRDNFMNKSVLYIATIIFMMAFPLLLGIWLAQSGSLGMDDGWKWVWVPVALFLCPQIGLTIGASGTLITHFFLRNNAQAKKNFYYPMSLLCYLAGSLISCIFLLNLLELI